MDEDIHIQVDSVFEAHFSTAAVVETDSFLVLSIFKTLGTPVSVPWPLESLQSVLVTLADKGAKA